MFGDTGNGLYGPKDDQERMEFFKAWDAYLDEFQEGNQIDFDLDGFEAFDDLDEYLRIERLVSLCSEDDEYIFTESFGRFKESCLLLDDGAEALEQETGGCPLLGK